MLLPFPWYNPIVMILLCPREEKEGSILRRVNHDTPADIETIKYITVGSKYIFTLFASLLNAWASLSVVSSYRCRPISKCHQAVVPYITLRPGRAALRRDTSLKFTTICKCEIPRIKFTRSSIKFLWLYFNEYVTLSEAN